MHRFVIALGVCPTIGECVSLPPEEAEHLNRVLRLKTGDAVEIFDDAGHSWSGEVADVSKSSAKVRVTACLPGREPSLRVTLFQGLPKSDKMELIIQKATELGVFAVVPVIMERSVARAQSGEGKALRWRRIALEATKQCGGARVPHIAEPIDSAEMTKRIRAVPFCDSSTTGKFRSSRSLSTTTPSARITLMPYEMEHNLTLPAALACAMRGQTSPLVPQAVSLIIGPEGGISPKEAEEWVGAGALAVTLGPRILRTETAAIAALSILLAGGAWPWASTKPEEGA